MSSTFPHTRKSRLGYDVDEVEEFLEDARRAYTAERSDATLVSADTIRDTAFTMRKGGYSPTHVDAALERLEDAFAARERDRALAQAGDQVWYAQARSGAQAVLDRIVRPRGKRFRRVSIFTVGYSVREVDALTDRVAQYFQSGKPLSIDDVRTSAFRGQRGGYLEAQVDILLDAVTRVMLAVR
ncbi:DivIVA domain-containing protein [Lysinimonas soli]|uniref:DivIVA domain-containing protein n=1 Tax=Lysinimonas soli TaxID=1074233 RepID=A0ABW0NVL4_9MICO